jgi:hypothetical protein
LDAGSIPAASTNSTSKDVKKSTGNPSHPQDDTGFLLAAEGIDPSLSWRNMRSKGISDKRRFARPDDAPKQPRASRSGHWTFKQKWQLEHSAAALCQALHAVAAVAAFCWRSAHSAPLLFNLQTLAVLIEAGLQS